MYVGNIHLPAIKTFKPGDVKRAIEAIGGLGHRGYVPAEFVAELPIVELSGHLLQKYGGSRTLQQYKEDVEALAQRRVGYNHVQNVKGRSGWVSVTGVDVDDDVGELWPVSVAGLWFDEAQYKVEYSSNPVTRANDWSITGIYDQATVEAADDVQCFDGTMGIFSTHHVFSGNCTIKNGMYQVILSENTISIYYWSGSNYTIIDDFSGGTHDRITVIEINQDVVKCKTSNGTEVTVERGRVPHILTTTDVSCTSHVPSDQSASLDNYLILGEGLYVCSDLNFSISDGTIDAGNLWIFHAESEVESVAHGCLVKSNLKRQVVSR
ncbi:hypothetical protein V7O66_13725 [Methanolobus sp. ZRKC3]|uniref:hypothetical protein n=1 Tax=Methanolobus sp. ZRKC3 TaxID=3125786 RepID=UPI003254B402